MENRRNIGLDILRILSMLMIVMLHLLGTDHGNVLKMTTPFSAKFYLSWGIEAFCVVAVNCFVLISGYFQVTSQFKLSKIIRLCVEVWCYSILIFSILVISGMIKLNINDIVLSFTPVLHRSYWFVTSYIGMMILSPFLNRLVSALSKREYQHLLAILLLMFSIVSTFYPLEDTFLVGGGSGIVWFCVLYIVAAYIRLHGIRKQKNRLYWLLVYISSCCLMLLSKIGLSFITEKVVHRTVGTSILYSYCSPICLLASIGLFIFFLNTNSENSMVNKLVLKIASCTFGVYLIHDNPVLRPILWNSLHLNTEGSIWGFLTKNVGIVLLIFGLCTIVEMLRQILFRKLKITNFINKIDR